MFKFVADRRKVWVKAVFDEALDGRSFALKCKNAYGGAYAQRSIWVYMILRKAWNPSSSFDDARKLFGKRLRDRYRHFVLVLNVEVSHPYVKAMHPLNEEARRAWA